MDADVRPAPEASARGADAEIMSRQSPAPVSSPVMSLGCQHTSRTFSTHLPASIFNRRTLAAPPYSTKIPARNPVQENILIAQPAAADRLWTIPSISLKCAEIGQVIQADCASSPALTKRLEQIALRSRP